MSYTKLFSSIVTSTIWTEDASVCKVWVTMLAIANKHGEVHASIPGLAQIAGLQRDVVESAIEKFLSPDRYSRTPDDEGRRIEPIDGGWILLNHAKYRAMASKDEEKTAAAKRQAAFRDRQKRNGKVTESNDLSRKGNATVTPNRDIAEAEADTDTNNLLLDVGETKPPKVGRKPSQRLVSGEGEDALWLAGLAKDPAYVGIDVAMQLGKMQRWCEVNRKEPTRRRFVNWLNRTEKPLAVSGSYRSKNQAYDAESQTAGKTGEEIGKF